MFEQSSSSSSSSSSAPAGTYFELGTNSVIVPGRRDPPQSLTPGTPYYGAGGYGFPLLLGTDFLQFPPTDIPSPLTPSINSPSAFGTFPTNQLYSRSSFPDFYSATSPMVQYSTGKKSTAGRKPKEEDMMDDDDDDKKLKRRQRNKEAAARCRQRRLDLMKELQDQVNVYKNLNENKTAECNDIRTKLASLKSYLETHDCKLSHDERLRHLNQLTIPAAQRIWPMSNEKLRIYTPRAESVAHSVLSNNSSSSSEQHSPIEDYKPSIDQLLPPITSISTLNDRTVNPMPPPPLPASTSAAGMSVITSIPVPQRNRSENVFAEPELKIPRHFQAPKLDPERTLNSLLTSEDVERPSMLPMLSTNPINQPITTPSRIFRYNGAEYQTPQNGNNLFVGGDVPGDFLATNTGLTPSGQPTMNFVSTPTPIVPHPEADLRPL